MTPRLAAERLELWLFRECNEGARRHLWHLFEFPLDEIRSHHTEHLCFRSILGMISSDAHEVSYWLPADVIRLVIAAREAWQEHGSSGDALDKALEPFASRVPYEDQLNDEGPCTDCEDTGITIQTERRCACQPTDSRDTQIAELKRVLKGWGDWYRLTDDGDDCAYLNGNAWPDAQALADMTMTALAKSEGQA